MFQDNVFTYLNFQALLPCEQCVTQYLFPQKTKHVHGIYLRSKLQEILYCEYWEINLIKLMF
jgi:hypothetical protein